MGFLESDSFGLVGAVISLLLFPSFGLLSGRLLTSGVLAAFLACGGGCGGRFFEEALSPCRR